MFDHNRKFTCPLMMCEACIYPCPYFAEPNIYEEDYFNDSKPSRPPFSVKNPIEGECYTRLKDYGPDPFVINIEDATEQNNNFRRALWTGKHLQLTLMSIGVGEDIGLENHPHTDQFLRIEEGQGLVQMGDRRDRLDFQKEVKKDYAIFVPAGKWHNLTNTGRRPIKLYSIYAPPEHPHGTVHKSKKDAEDAERRQNP